MKTFYVVEACDLWAQSNCYEIDCRSLEDAMMIADSKKSRSKSWMAIYYNHGDQRLAYRPANEGWRFD